MTSTTIRRTAASAVAIGVAAALAAAPGAQAQSSTTADVSNGSTTLRLSAVTAKVLKDNKISLGTVNPARSNGLNVTFPVAASGSALDPKTFAGTLNHRGGLTFKAGGKTLRLTNFRVSVGSKSSLNARINNGSRATIISLNTSRAKIVRTGLNTNVAGIVASLNGTGAKALNSYFNVKLFKNGLRLGTVRSQAVYSQVIFQGGQTELALNASTLSTLGTLGLTPGIVAPGTLSGTTASFPITGGKVNTTNLSGSITHSGGISLTAGATRVELLNFDIQAPKLLASVNGTTPAAIIDLDASKAKITVSGRNVTVAGVDAKLSSVGANGLNAAFNTTALSAGIPIGTATVKGQAR